MTGRRSAGLALAALLLALPARAADKLDAKGAWALFAGACGKIVDGPKAAAEVFKARGWQPNEAKTADGFFTFGTITLGRMVGGNVVNLSLTYGSERYEGGIHRYCMLQIFGNEAPAVPGLAEAVNAGAESLIGKDMEKKGGAMEAAGKTVAWNVAYLAGGFPAKKFLRLNEVSRYATLSFGRMTPAGETKQ